MSHFQPRYDPRDVIKLHIAPRAEAMHDLLQPGRATFPIGCDEAQAGQLEEALTLMGLIQQHPSSYQESKDRLVRLETELRTKLSPQQLQTALARGPAAELWATVAAMKRQLDTEPQRTQQMQEVRIEVNRVGMTQQQDYRY